MIYNKFYINIIIRVFLILATCFLIVFTYPTAKPILLINHTILLIIQVLLLIKYINKINYELADFFESIVNKDYNFLKFSRNRGKSYNKLYSSLSTIGDTLKKSEIENIFTYQYLFTAIENVGTGLIWFDEKGDVLLLNKAAKGLLNLNSIQNISELDDVISGFSTILENIKPSENKVVKIKIDNEYKQLSVNSTELIQQKKHIKLISLQNIKNELDEVELESWQKLIRVLAHEIMNSIGPITTSTTAISKYFKNVKGEVIEPEKLDKIIIKNTIKGLDIIEERSLGLKDFVGNYRQLTNLPTPEINKIKLSAFFEKIEGLFKEDFRNNNISFEYIVKPENLVLEADEKLISHIIINLIKNSIEAVQETNDARVSIDVKQDDSNQIVIQIKDNGHGIPDDIIDKIFIPFFTTKVAGSGIGLSLSRQIMRLHNGTISVNSSKKGTEFKLKF